MKHTTRSLVAVMFALGLGACADDAPGMGVDSQAICDCPAATAATTTYDNVGSGLADSNVQGAVDELAARAEGKADAWGRVTLEQVVMMSPSTGVGYVAQAACPGGEPKALGGSCEASDSAAILQGTSLQGNAFSCIWGKPEGVAVEFTTRVTCLAKAE